MKKSICLVGLCSQAAALGCAPCRGQTATVPTPGPTLTPPSRPRVCSRLAVVLTRGNARGLVVLLIPDLFSLPKSPGSPGRGPRPDLQALPEKGSI